MSEGVVPCRADLALVGVSKEVYQSWDEAGRRVAMRYEADKMMFESQWRLVRHHVMWEGKRGRRMELGSMILIRSSTHNIVNRGARIHKARKSIPRQVLLTTFVGCVPGGGYVRYLSLNSLKPHDSWSASS